MKEYTSCFIGIPLPREYQQDFEELLVDISQIAPLIETDYPKTPHITEYYLDKQSQFNLPKIAEIVQTRTSLLKNTRLSVGGLGYFGGDNPRVIFLNVQYPDTIREFNKIITENLACFYTSDNNLPFHPHMTVARLRTPQAQQSFKNVKSKLSARLNEVSWIFPVTEVVLFGVDSTKNPQYQERLISIPVI